MTLIPRYALEFKTEKWVERLNTRVLYADGSYDHGVAGWAVVEGDQCLHQGWARGITSNMAEGKAILSALTLVGEGSAVIFSDSMAWVNALNNNKNIKGKGAKEIMLEARNLLHPLISLKWIPAHTTVIQGNELADSYARHARLSKDSLVK